MKAKSAALSSTRQGSKAPPASDGRRRATVRMPAAQRRAQIQAKAFEFFAEYGLTAQTRALAQACGVSQRLLYSAFPNKAALIASVYEEEIAGPFKAIWLVQLRDRSVPLAQRLTRFYTEYYEGILTRRWLRLFLYASLAEVDLAPTYISAIIRSLLQAIVEEAACDCGQPLPQDAALAQEIGWVLHGNVSHLAIRRHIYRDGTSVTPERVIGMHVRAFLATVPALLAEQAEQAPAAKD